MHNASDYLMLIVYLRAEQDDGKASPMLNTEDITGLLNSHPALSIHFSLWFIFTSQLQLQAPFY